MVSMEEPKEVKSWWCEANKKVSYKQRSPVEIKKANASRKFSSSGQSFSFAKNEVIESALFEKVTRDCHGEVVRKSPLRRFRKVGSDEWYSVPAQAGNSNWEKTFAPANDSEMIAQGDANKKNAGQEDIDSSVDVQEDVLTVTKTKASEQMGITKEADKKVNGRKLFLGLALLAAAAITYKMFNKK